MMNNAALEAKLIDGKTVSKEIRKDLKKRIETLKSRGIVPGLAAIWVGDNPASQIYVTSKARACEKIGISSEIIRRPASITADELYGLVKEQNDRKEIDGILVQLPLPDHIDEMAVTLLIDPNKDVDGFHPYNVGMMLIGKPTFLPCTPYGILELLKYYDIDPAGKEVVILGRSNIVGKPVGVMLLQKARMANATVTFCHSRTADLDKVCRRADILIAAIGKAEFVRPDMIKEGVVIIDVGQNRIDDESVERGYRIVGDVDFHGCAEKASYITPVPGGVGPMTIAMLMSNTVKAAESRADAM